MKSETKQAIRRNVMQRVIPVAAASAADRKRQAAQIRDANKYCDSFFDQQEFGSPFKCEQEAIKAMAPLAVWFIGWAARQFAIMVIKALWREWSNYQATNGLVCKTKE